MIPIDGIRKAIYVLKISGFTNNEIYASLRGCPKKILMKLVKEIIITEINCTTVGDGL